MYVNMQCGDWWRVKVYVRLIHILRSITQITFCKIKSCSQTCTFLDHRLNTWYKHIVQNTAHYTFYKWQTCVFQICVILWPLCRESLFIAVQRLFFSWGVFWGFSRSLSSSLKQVLHIYMSVLIGNCPSLTSCWHSKNKIGFDVVWAGQVVPLGWI